MSKRKLLLADDSITIQKVVNLTFADEGIEVFTVGDGDSAMEKLREFSPDLIMADVNMPGLNGYQICESIKQDEFQKHIPVILLVGSFEPFDEKEAERVGADGFLTKPFQSIRQLVTKVTDLLNSNERKILVETVSEPSGDNFAETLEMPKPIESQKFSDDEFDDEMIQTSQIGSFALDEAQKFETRPVIQYDAEDYGKTQPLSAEEVKDFAFSHANDLHANDLKEEPIVNQDFEKEELQDYSHNTEEKIVDFEETNGELEESEFQSAETITNLTESEDSLEISKENIQEAKTEELPYPVSASILDLDEDILELPPVEGEDSNEFEEENIAQAEETTASHSLLIDETAQEPVSESVAAETLATTNSIDSSQISPELIDLIVQKVIEKLSDKAVKDVAWEVVPQMAELIVRQIAEEKLKE